MTDQDLYDLVLKVNEEFYERVYADDWFRQIFAVIDKTIITRQQTDFMVGALGGPKRYCGRTPSDAHPHIFINEAMWELREKYLVEAFEKVACPEEIRKKWLRIDEAFKRSILKKSLADCKGRYATDEIIYFPEPPATRKRSA